MNRFFQLVPLVACCMLDQRVAYSGGDIEVTAGERIYIQCTGCHAPAYHRVGPKHCGLLGRHAGSEPEFEFTQTMKDSGIIWTKATLDRFLKSPLDMMPGSSMGFVGIASSRERAQLINFLGTLTETNPLCR